jgi:hypothetical protein
MQPLLPPLRRGLQLLQLVAMVVVEMAMVVVEMAMVVVEKAMCWFWPVVVRFCCWMRTRSNSYVQLTQRAAPLPCWNCVMMMRFLVLLILNPNTLEPAASLLLSTMGTAG